MQHNKICDHVIGLFYLYQETHLVTLANLKDRIVEDQEFHRAWLDAGLPDRRTPFTLAQHCDFRRRTNLEKFSHCPRCGEKIDWKQIAKKNPNHTDPEPIDTH